MLVKLIWYWVTLAWSSQIPMMNPDLRELRLQLLERFCSPCRIHWRSSAIPTISHSEYQWVSIPHCGQYLPLYICLRDILKRTSASCEERPRPFSSPGTLRSFWICVSICWFDTLCSLFWVSCWPKVTSGSGAGWRQLATCFSRASWCSGKCPYPRQSVHWIPFLWDCLRNDESKRNS